MADLLRRKQSILKDTEVVETRDDYPDYEDTGIRPKVDNVPRQRELWVELVAETKARQEALDAPRQVPQGVFLARQYLLPQYTGPVTKKARTGADQAGAGAVPKKEVKSPARVLLAGLTRDQDDLLQTVQYT